MKATTRRRVPQLPDFDSTSTGGGFNALHYVINEHAYVLISTHANDQIPKFVDEPCIVNVYDREASTDCLVSMYAHTFADAVRAVRSIVLVSNREVVCGFCRTSGHHYKQCPNR